jgi:hypothetical protein
MRSIFVRRKKKPSSACSRNSTCKREFRRMRDAHVHGNVNTSASASNAQELRARLRCLCERMAPAQADDVREFGIYSNNEESRQQLRRRRVFRSRWCARVFSK